MVVGPVGGDGAEAVELHLAAVGQEALELASSALDA
jgi:hypothetical protein